MDYLAIGAFVVAVLALGYSFYQSKRPVNVENLTELVQATPATAAELQAVAEIFVYGNEQRIREGKLTKSEAYDNALNSIRRWASNLNVEVPFSNDQILGAVNMAILGASAITAQINQSKAIVADPALPPDTAAPPVPVQPVVGRTGLI